jgi:hypothetical protein
VIQPADIGNGHVRQGHWMSKFDDRVNANIGINKQVEQILLNLINSGHLDIEADKKKMINNLAGRVGNVVRLAFDEKSVLDSFVKAGFIDSKCQGVDVLKIIGTVKRPVSEEMKQKIIGDLPRFVAEMIRYGRISEDTFDELNYPVDTDLKGNEYHLPDNWETQPHRQRTLILHNQTHIDAFRQIEEAKMKISESAKAEAAKEIRW